METNLKAVYITFDLLPEPEIKAETERKREKEMKRERHSEIGEQTFLDSSSEIITPNLNMREESAGQGCLKCQSCSDSGSISHKLTKFNSADNNVDDNAVVSTHCCFHVASWLVNI